MPHNLITKYIILSLFFHLAFVLALQIPLVFVSNGLIYTIYDVTEKSSDVAIKNNAAKFIPVKNTSKIKAETLPKQTEQSNSRSTGSNSMNTSDLPEAADSQLVSKGLIPINIEEINKSIKRTQAATENNIEGIIKLKLLVDETGHVRQVTALTRLGYGLDEVALAAAWKLIFKPAQIDSKNVALETIYSVKFNINHQ